MDASAKAHIEKARLEAAPEPAAQEHESDADPAGDEGARRHEQAWLGLGRGSPPS